MAVLVIKIPNIYIYIYIYIIIFIYWCPVKTKESSCQIPKNEAFFKKIKGPNQSLYGLANFPGVIKYNQFLTVFSHVNSGI